MLSVEIAEIYSHKKISWKLLKSVTTFCGKMVRVKFCHFYNVLYVNCEVFSTAIICAYYGIFVLLKWNYLNLNLFLNS